MEKALEQAFSEYCEKMYIDLKIDPTLFPMEKGMKCSSLRSRPASSMNLSGLKLVPSPQWSPFSTSVSSGCISVLAGMVWPCTSRSRGQMCWIPGGGGNRN